MATQARIVDFEEARTSSSRRASKRTSSARVYAGGRASKAQNKRNSSAHTTSAHTTASEKGVRAALYKGKMGPTHKKATKMQSSKPSVSAEGIQLGNVHIGRKGGIALLICACLVAGCAFLYSPAKNYYVAVRDQAKAEVAYEIVTTRNAALIEDVSMLSTEAGIEDRVREQYGWVKEGENAVNVVGLADDGNLSAAEILRTVTLNDVKAPETWYSPLLDSVFGYEG